MVYRPNVKVLLHTSCGPIYHKLQRYYCHHCHISFTSQGYGQHSRHSYLYQQEVVLDFVASKSSSREVAYRFGVNHCTILNWTQSLSDQMNLQMIPRPTVWSGYICFDGLKSAVKGEKRVILIATVQIPILPLETSKQTRLTIHSLKKNLGALRKNLEAEIFNL